MNEQNDFTNNQNGFQDPTVNPVQPDAAMPADNNAAAPEQPMNVQPTADTAYAPVSEPQQPTPPTYEQYAAQQAAAQQNQQNQQQFGPQNGGYNPQYNVQNQQQYQPQQPYQQPPVYQNFQPNARPVAQDNGMAVASLILGILAHVCCLEFLGILALIFGIIALNKSKTMCGNGKGMAIAGIILGAISVVLIVIMILGYSVYGFALFQTIQNDYDYSTDFYSMIRMCLPL